MLNTKKDCKPVNR